MKNSLGISIIVDKDGYINAEVRSLNDHDKEIEALAEGNGFKTAKWVSLEKLQPTSGPAKTSDASTMIH